MSIENTYLGPIPENILIALFKNTAFVGCASTNPFNFHHYDMINFELYGDGVQHPSKPLTRDWSSAFGATTAYETLFSSTGIHHDDCASTIKLETFTNGFYLLGFGLTHNKEANEEHISLPRQGNVCIEAGFKKPLPEPVPCILCAESPGHFEIDKLTNDTVE